MSGARCVSTSTGTSTSAGTSTSRRASTRRSTSVSTLMPHSGIDRGRVLMKLVLVGARSEHADERDALVSVKLIEPLLDVAELHDEITLQLRTCEGRRH